MPEKADAVIGLKPILNCKLEELARKSTEGELTEDERAEYAGYGITDRLQINELSDS